MPATPASLKSPSSGLAAAPPVPHTCLSAFKQQLTACGGQGTTRVPRQVRKTWAVFLRNYMEKHRSIDCELVRRNRRQRGPAQPQALCLLLTPSPQKCLCRSAKEPCDLAHQCSRGSEVFGFRGEKESCLRKSARYHGKRCVPGITILTSEQ